MPRTKKTKEVEFEAKSQSVTITTEPIMEIEKIAKLSDLEIIQADIAAIKADINDLSSSPQNLNINKKEQ